MAILIGIVGGIGSGKSAVAEQFRRLGAEVLDGDRLGHEVLEESEVIGALRNRWGDRVLNKEEPGGAAVAKRVNRSEVARIVFAGTPEAETELHFLEGLTHPLIRRRIEERVAAIAQRGKTPVVVLDAPLLLEAGWDEVCDHVIYIDVPREVRLKRLEPRRWDPANLAAREARQLPLSEKRQRADWIIDNSGPREELATQIEAIWRSLTLPKST